MIVISMYLLLACWASVYDCGLVPLAWPSTIYSSLKVRQQIWLELFFHSWFRTTPIYMQSNRSHTFTQEALQRPGTPMLTPTPLLPVQLPETAASSFTLPQSLSLSVAAPQSPRSPATLDSEAQENSAWCRDSYVPCSKRFSSMHRTV